VLQTWKTILNWPRALNMEPFGLDEARDLEGEKKVKWMEKSQLPNRNIDAYCSLKLIPVI